MTEPGLGESDRTAPVLIEAGLIDVVLIDAGLIGLDLFETDFAADLGAEFAADFAPLALAGADFALADFDIFELEAIALIALREADLAILLPGRLPVPDFTALVLAARDFPAGDLAWRDVEFAATECFGRDLTVAMPRVFEEAFIAATDLVAFDGDAAFGRFLATPGLAAPALPEAFLLVFLATDAPNLSRCPVGKNDSNPALGPATGQRIAIICINSTICQPLTPPWLILS